MVVVRAAKLKGFTVVCVFCEVSHGVVDGLMLTVSCLFTMMYLVKSGMSPE